MVKNKIIMCIVMLCTMISCSKEDKSLPPVRTDILCATSNAEGIVDRLILDNNKIYKVEGQSIDAKEKSKTLRCLCTYQVNADSSVATVYDIAKISCYTPMPVDSFKTHPMDPVNVVSVYKTGKFINLHLQMLTTGMKGNQYDLCLDSIKGSTLHCSFLFQRVAADNESYSKDIYHSIPLHPANFKMDFDSLHININTYGGMKVYRFAR